MPKIIFLFITFLALSFSVKAEKVSTYKLGPDESTDIIIESSKPKMVRWRVKFPSEYWDMTSKCPEFKKRTMSLKLCGGIYEKKKHSPGSALYIESQHGGGLEFDPDEKGQIDLVLKNLSGMEMEFVVEVEDVEQ